MKEQNDHLNIDLDFLDKKEPAKVVKKHDPEGGKDSNTSTSLPKANKWNWKNILIIGGVILFFGWAIFSGDSNSSSSSGSSYTPSNIASDDLVTYNGQTFRCSDSNYNKAMQLKPSASLATQLKNESDTLDAQIAASKRERATLDAMYVDQSNQYEIDNYNERVDNYNYERQRLINAANDFQQRTKTFDAQIDTYNNFLDSNCRPQ